MTTLLARDDPTWPAAAGSAPANAGMYPDLVPTHLLPEPHIGGPSVVAAAWRLATVGLLQPSTRAVAWWLGAAGAAGMLARYLASRTVGLPPGRHEGWDDPHGVACLLLRPPPRPPPWPPTPRER